MNLNPVNHLWSIAAVERDTGLSKDTLRAWERRYGFPNPTRDASGERVYALGEVEKLRTLKRMLDLGHRPGRVVHLSLGDLHRLCSGPEAPARALEEASALDPSLAPFYAAVCQHDVQGLKRLMSQACAAHGLNHFVMQVVAPLTTRVGDGWMRGELQVFQEHGYSEVVQNVLRHALQQLPSPGVHQAPRVLLTTLPQEQHGLGLLMVEALLGVQGCALISFGLQMPVREIVAAVAAHLVDVVALSFSVAFNANQVLDGLTELRALLPREVEIWAGGRSGVLQRRDIPGVQVVSELKDLAGHVERWRRAAAAPIT